MPEPVQPAPPPAPATTVPLISPEGAAHDVPLADAAGLLTSGWRSRTPDDTSRFATEAAKELDYGGFAGGARATLEAGARGATLGLSDVGARILGVPARDLQGRREQNPTLATVAEIGGGLLPAVVAPESLLARSPAGAVSTLGRQIARGAEEEAANILTRIGGQTAAAALEGAVQGGGAYLSEVALQDKPLAAEGFMGAMGKGALWGAGIGGVLSGAEHGIRGGAKALVRAKSLFPKSEVTRQAAKAIDREATSAISQAAQDSQQMASVARRKIAAAQANGEAARAMESTTRTMFGDALPDSMQNQVVANAEQAQLEAALQQMERAQTDLAQWVRSEADPDLEAALRSIRAPNVQSDAAPRLSAPEFGEAVPPRAPSPDLGEFGVQRTAVGRRGARGTPPDGIPELPPLPAPDPPPGLPGLPEPMLAEGTPVTGANLTRETVVGRVPAEFQPRTDPISGELSQQDKVRAAGLDLEASALSGMAPSEIEARYQMALEAKDVTWRQREMLENIGYPTDAIEAMSPAEARQILVQRRPPPTAIPEAGAVSAADETASIGRTPPSLAELPPVPSAEEALVAQIDELRAKRDALNTPETRGKSAYVKAARALAAAERKLADLRGAAPVADDIVVPESLRGPVLSKADRTLTADDGMDDVEFDAFKKNLLPVMPPEASDAALLYSKGGDEVINGALRSGKKLDGIYAEAVDSLDALYDLPEARLPRDMVLYRGLSTPDGIKRFADLKPGDILQDPAYLSTAGAIDSRSRNEAVVFNIRARAGQPGAAIPSKYSSEQEILLPRGVRIRVDSIRREPLLPSKNAWTEAVGYEMQPDGSALIKLKNGVTVTSEPRQIVDATIIDDFAPPKAVAKSDKIALDSDVGQMSLRDVGEYQRLLEAEFSRLEAGSPEYQAASSKWDRAIERRNKFKSGELADVAPTPVTAAPDIPGAAMPSGDVSLDLNVEWMSERELREFKRLAEARLSSAPQAERAVLQAKIDAADARILETELANQPALQRVGEVIPKSYPGKDGVIPELAKTDDRAADYVMSRAREQGVRFGSDNVFLGSLGIDWTNPTHKRTLMGLLRDGKLRLTRADLVEVHDPKLVASSEIKDRGSHFHFVVDDGSYALTGRSGLPPLPSAAKTAGRYSGARRAPAAPPVDAGPGTVDDALLVGDLPALPAAESPPTDTLTGLLRGTKAKLDAGEDIHSIGEPVRAQYAADKAERTAQQADHFRALARGERSALPDVQQRDVEQIAGAMSLTPVSTIDVPEDAIAQALRRRNGKDVDIGPNLAAGAKAIDAFENASANLAEALGPDAPPSAAAHASAYRAARARQAEVSGAAAAQTIDDINNRVMPALRSDAIPPMMTRRLKNQLGGLGFTRSQIDNMTPGQAWNALRQRVREAPDSAATVVDDEIMAALRKAESRPQRQPMSTRAPSPPDAPPVAAAPDVTVVEPNLLAATHRAADADAQAAGKAVDSLTREQPPAAAPVAGEAAATPAAGARRSGLLSLAADAGTAIEVLGALGVGVPDLSQIPVIGPVLSMFLKARAAMGILGRRGGSIARTGETTIAQKSSETHDRVVKAVTRIMEAGAGAAARGAKRAAPVVGVAGALGYKLFPGDGETKSKDTRVLYEARIDELARAQSPGAVERAVSDRVRVADPMLQAAVASQARRVSAYLLSKAPRETLAQTMIPGDGKWHPSKTAIEQWSRYVAAVHDPAGVLEDLANGHITSEGAEVLRDVYPGLYGLAQRVLLEKAPDMHRTLPYPRRVAISIMFQIPIDGTMSPQHLRFLQTPKGPQGGPQGAPAAALPPGAPQQPPPMPPPPALTGPLQLGQTTMTSLERRAGV